MIATIPTLVVEAPVSASRAVGRSWRLMGGNWWGVLAAIVTLFLAQYLVLAPLIGADDVLRSPGRQNPIVLALADAGMAAAASAYHIGILAIGIAVYRRLASKGM